MLPKTVSNIAMILTALAVAPVSAATSYSVTVDARAYAPSTSGPAGSSQLSERVDSTTGVALGLNTGIVNGQQEVAVGYDGRCVVIATGAPCTGNEAPLTTRTVLNGNKPIMAAQPTSASADVSAYARNGKVGARASSSASTGYGHATIDPNNPERSIPGRFYTVGDSGAGATASIRHTNTLLGPVGSVATITLRGVASSELFINTQPGMGNTAQADLFVQGSAAPMGQRCSYYALGCVADFGFSRYADPSSSVPISLGSERRSYAFSFQARANDIVTLYASAFASTHNNGSADASHTLTIDEIELSNGFSFADESEFVRVGNSYAFAAAVPEPEQWALMAAGLMLVGAWARRAAA